jgi:hypothetical protein
MRFSEEEQAALARAVEVIEEVPREETATAAALTIRKMLGR